MSAHWELGYHGPRYPAYTGSEMCEAIAAWVASQGGPVLKAEDIWNYSPTGELYAVFALWDQCLEYGMPLPSREPT